MSNNKNKNRNKNRNNNINTNKTKNVNDETIELNDKLNDDLDDEFDDNMFNTLIDIDDESEIQEIQEISQKKSLGKKGSNNQKHSNNQKNSKSKTVDKIEEPVKDVVADCRRVLRNKQKEEPETTMIEDFKKNIVLWGILGVLFIILIIALIVTNVKDKDSSDEKSTEKTTKTQQESNEPATEDSGKLVPEAADSEITQLIINYKKASEIEASLDEVAKYVDSIENISIEKFENIKKYIEDFTNVECYKINSIDENTYIVVATFGCKFYNIETAAPGCETYIVIKKDNELKIHNLTKQETLETYISSDIDVTLINQINKEVNDSLKAAIESDTELQRVVEILQQ